MKHKLLVRKTLLVITFLAITTLIFSGIIALALTTPTNNTEQVEKLNINYYQSSNNGYEEVAQTSTLTNAVSLTTENIIVVSVLMGIVGLVGAQVAFVAIKSAKQTKENSKETKNDKSDSDVIVADELESEGFEVEEPIAEVEEEPIAEVEEEPIAEVEEEPIAEVEEEPITEVEEEPIVEVEEEPIVEVEEEPIAEVEEELTTDVIEESLINTEEELIVDSEEENIQILSTVIENDSEIQEENETEEENEESITLMDGDRVVHIKMARSFTAKLIQGDEFLQTSYMQLKNHVMGYKNVKDRMSFPYDSINKGRQQLVKFVIRGKRLCVYCALNADEVPETWHTDTSTSKRYQNVPTFIRVRGSVTFSRAMKMIDLTCEKYNLLFIKDNNIDYRMPYEPNEPLIARNLIKVYADGDTDGAKLVMAKFGDNLIKETESEEVEEILEEKIEENIDLDADGEEKEVITINDGDNVIRIRIVKSFSAKLIQGNELIQEGYNVLKNHILGYTKASSRMSFPYDSVNCGKQQLIKFVIRGKFLFMYCALQPNEVTESWHSEVTKYKRYQTVPVYIKIKGNTTIEVAKRMINQTCKKYGLKFTEAQSVDYKMPYEPNAPLIDRKLIKIYSDTTLDNSMLIKAKYGTSFSVVSATEVGNMMSDNDASEIVKNSVELKENSSENKNCVVKSGKKGIVNIDTLSKTFENGDVIDLQILIDKNILQSNVTYLKILARGSLDKRFTVKANSFSLDAVKMITLLGGKVVTIK